MTRSNTPGRVAEHDGRSLPGERPAPPVVAEPVVEPTGPVSRWDRVRWGAVWAGALTVLTTYLILQLLFFALGWLDFAVTGPTSVITTVTSAVLALVAFFVGGMTAGAAVTSRGSRMDGILNGVVVWALTVAILLVFGLLGAGALIGPLGDLTAQGGSVTGADVTTARQAAGWTALGLGLAVIVTAVGAGTGTKKKA